MKVNADDVRRMASQEGSKRGFTLLEIMIAMAIFMIVLGAAAQSLVFSHQVLTVEEQRTNALHGCKTVLSALREIAYSDAGSANCPDTQPLFPCTILDWIDNFPQSEGLIEPEDRDAFASFFILPDQFYTISCLDSEGNPADASPVPNLNSNPVFVTITTTWTGMRGREFTMSLSAALTNR